MIKTPCTCSELMSGFWEILDANGKHFADTDSKADAEEIVNALNNHELLVETAKLAAIRDGNYEVVE